MAFILARTLRCGSTQHSHFCSPHRQTLRINSKCFPIGVVQHSNPLLPLALPLSVLMNVALAPSHCPTQCHLRLHTDRAAPWRHAHSTTCDCSKPLQSSVRLFCWPMPTLLDKSLHLSHSCIKFELMAGPAPNHAQLDRSSKRCVSTPQNPGMN